MLSLSNECYDLSRHGERHQLAIRKFRSVIKDVCKSCTTVPAYIKDNGKFKTDFITLLYDQLLAGAPHQKAVSVPEVGGHDIRRHTRHGLTHLPNENGITPLHYPHPIPSHSPSWAAQVT